MLHDVLDLLMCPHCGDDLLLQDGTVRCPAGHSHDIAKQGYVNLLRGAAPFTGDTTAMVEARVAFLGAGHFDPITRALVAAADPGPGCVVDLGAGTGHHLAAVLDAFPGREGVALDVSKHALRRAAKAHPLVGAVVADVWQPLPVRSGVAGLVINVFAPRNAAELRRVLHPEGALVVVAPTGDHLGELVSALDLLTVEADKQEGIDDRLGEHFTVAARETVEFQMSLSHKDVEALVGMGPSAFHGRGAAAGLTEPVAVTGSVAVTRYAPR
ncbi:putative RNA methyltransferase [Actinokineospora sp. G85]|uniref:putative RNA methyltransferase n=1 Tax=Actinokineospora sp. G85 TaxID=3406626 RepID=UPI003C76D6DE